MNPELWNLLRVLAPLGAGLVFLLVGWRLGRESVGRPMFDFPLAAPPPGAVAEEADPWDEAALGRQVAPAAMDIFETLSPREPVPGRAVHPKPLE